MKKTFLTIFLLSLSTLIWAQSHVNDSSKAVVSGLSTGGSSIVLDSASLLNLLNTPPSITPSTGRPGTTPPNGSGTFFDPAGGGGTGGVGGPGGVATRPSTAEITYVQVGLNRYYHPWGILERPWKNDDDMTGGTKVHSATACGGTGSNCWSQVINIPFQFDFYGESFNQLCVSKNGLLTFDTSVAGTNIPISNIATALPNPLLPNNTIAYFWGTYLNLDASDHVYAFLYGNAPNRQVWFINAGHNKFLQGDTYSAVVLEEGTNHIYVVDMACETERNKNDGGLLTVGIQKDGSKVSQVPASPRVQIAGNSLAWGNNSYYFFKPYAKYQVKNGDAPASLNDIDTLVADEIEASNIPGMGVAVTMNGKLVYSKGIGFSNVEENEQADRSSRWRMASISKPLTSTGIMKLVELNVLDLDDQVFGTGGILDEPGYRPLFDPQMNNITVRMLLNHTAGWDRGRGIGDPINRPNLMLASDALNLNTPPSTDSLIAYMLRFQPLDTIPGNQYNYSNLGYIVLGRVIEKITGMSYEDYMKAYIFAPSGMHSLELTANNYANRHLNEVRYYDYYTFSNYCQRYPWGLSVYDDTDQTYAYRPYAGMYNMEAMDAHGGWISKPDDLARMLCAVDQLPNRADILPSNLVDTMFTTYAAGNSLGWFFTNGGAYNHGGALPGTRALLIQYTNGVGVVLLGNIRNGNLNGLANNIANVVSTATIPPTYDLFGGSITTGGSATGGIRMANPFAEEEEALASIQAYPNPFDDQITLLLGNTDEEKHIQIFDMNGRMLHQTHTKESNLQIAGDYMPTSGIYLIKISSGSVQKTIKVIKQ